MTPVEILGLYRELYASELERKDSITLRIQLRFALVLTVFTAFVYILKTLDIEQQPGMALGVLELLTLSVVFLVWCSSKLLRAYTGNQYDFLPYANEIEDYRQETLSGTNKGEDSFVEYLIKEYSDCAGEVSRVNDERQALLNQSTGYLKLACVFVFLAGSIFIFLDMDASSPRKPISIVIEK